LRNLNRWVALTLTLDRAAEGYTLRAAGDTFTAEVRVSSRTGKASGDLKAKTITLAIARALGLEAHE
jgi:hypothetical protein